MNQTKNQEKPTPQQEEAIQHIDGPLLIIAGPGAGKTKVLIDRVEYMIDKKKIDPDKILVTTFTVKAAEEIKSRIVKKIGAKAQAMQISTIHSLCQTILEHYSEYHAFGAAFDVIDEETQLLFFRAHYYRLGLKNIISKSDLPELISLFNILGENCIYPCDLAKCAELYSDKEDYLKYCKVYEKYLALLKEDYKIDFANLQKEAYQLLKSNLTVLNEIQNQYHYLLIDEYQDTNAIQAEIFKLIAGKRMNICVVGDEDQSIYGFRGANIDNFRTFSKTYPKTKIIRLERNFRSKSQIVSVAEHFMKNYRTISKKIAPNQGKGNDVLLVRGVNAYKEGEMVVDLIKEMKKRKIIPHYGYVTLLFRSVTWHAKPFVEILKENKIQFDVKGAGGFLNRDEIKTTLYLMAYVDPPDYEGKFAGKWSSWWNVSMFKTEVLGLSEESIAILEKFPKNFDISLLLEDSDFKKIGINDKKDVDKLKTINNLKKELTDKKSILGVFYEIMKRTKYFNRLFLKNDDDSKSKLYNLALLTQLISKYESVTRKSTIEDFLWYCYSMPKEMDERSLTNPYALKIMTIHQSKGLEFPVVIICSVMRGRFPKYQSRNNSETLIPIPESLLLAKPERGVEEDRRLFYVGMTRAQDILVLSTADKIDLKGGGVSEFIVNDIGMDKLKTPKELIESCEKYSPRPPTTVKLSYSALNTYYECPFRFQLNYIYEFRHPAGYMQNYGLILHNSLHRLHLAIKRGEEIDFEKVKDIVDKSWIRLNPNEKKDQVMKQNLQTKIYFEYYERMKDYMTEILSTEEPFTLVFDEFIVAGRIDLLIKNKAGESELIDFKSVREEGVTKMNVEMQLQIYAYALRNKYKLDKLAAYTFKDNKMTYFKIDHEILNGIDSKLKNIVKNIKEEKFEPKRNAFCSNCTFKFTCKVWGG